MTGSEKDRAAVVAARRIAADMVDLAPGQPLPPERTMLVTYGVGRGTLREALRILETMGAIVMKPGQGGGPVVNLPTEEHLHTALAIILQARRTPFSVVVEARSTLEPVLAAIAARRASAAQLAALQRAVDAMRASIDDLPEFLRACHDFHAVIAWGTNNEVLALTVSALQPIGDEATDTASMPPEARRQVLLAHEDITIAIRLRDGDRAFAAMSRHMQEFERSAAQIPRLMHETVSWS